MIPRPKFRKFRSGRPEDYLKPDSPNKPTIVSGLFGGINVSEPAYKISENEATFIKNAFTKEGIFQKCPGLVKFGTVQPLDEKIWGLIDYKIANGNSKFLAITGRSVYYLATPTNVWTYVTGGQDCFIPEQDKRVSFQVVYSETVGDFILICTNYLDYVKYYNNTNIQNLFTTWKAKYTKNYEFFQFYAYISEGGINYPQKIYWSDIGKPEAITTGLSGGVVLAKTPDFLTGLSLLGGSLFVGKEKSCSIINYTGSAVQPFTLEENIFDVGVVGSTIGNIGDELLFLGSDRKVYLTDGTTKKDVSMKIKKLFDDRINWTLAYRSSGWVSLDERWYFLAIPTTGYIEPNEVWVLDIKDLTWQSFQAWNKIICFDEFKDTGILVGELTSKLGVSTWRIGDLASFQNRPLLGNADGYVYEWNKSYLNSDNVAIDSYFDTKDYYWDFQLIKRVTQLMLELYGSGNMMVYYSTDEGLIWNLIGTITMTSLFEEHFIYPNKNCQKIRFRFRCNGLDEFYYIKKYVINKIDKGFIKDVV